MKLFLILLWVALMLLFALPTLAYVVYYFLKLHILKNIHKQVKVSIGEVVSIDYKLHIVSPMGIVYTIRYTDSNGNPITSPTEEYPVKNGHIFKVGDSVGIVYSNNYGRVFFNIQDLEERIQRCRVSILKYVALELAILVVFTLPIVALKYLIYYHS